MSDAREVQLIVAYRSGADIRLNVIVGGKTEQFTVQRSVAASAISYLAVALATDPPVDGASML